MATNTSSTHEAEQAAERDQAERRREQEMVARAREGDSEAKSWIVEKHQRNVYNLGLRLMGNSDQAEVILQETFLKVFEKLESFRGDARLGTWIHRIATNAALMRIRSRKNKYFVPIEDQTGDSEDEDVTPAYVIRSLDRDPLELTLDDELKGRLEQSIAALPENLRTAFVLKDLEGYSMAQIGEEVGKSVSAVKADLHRARVKLRSMLAEFVEEGQHGNRTTA